MRSFLISESKDTLLGLRLTGIEGVLVNTDEEMEDSFKEAVSNSEIGIIILTEYIFEKIKDQVLDFKNRSDMPLITTIPGVSGLKDKDFIMKYVKDSIGIKI